MPIYIFAHRPYSLLYGDPHNYERVAESCPLWRASMRSLQTAKSIISMLNCALLMRRRGTSSGE
jgi:hypothetical protein